MKTGQSNPKATQFMKHEVGSENVRFINHALQMSKRGKKNRQIWNKVLLFQFSIIKCRILGE